MNTLSKLVTHCVWANRKLVDFLITEQIADTAVLTLIGHVGHGETAWFQRIAGLPLDKDVFKPISLVDLRALFDAHARFYEELLLGDLSRVIAYRRFNGDAYQSTIDDILMHLCTHGFHHRGQIAALLSKAGKKMPNLDFINFCRETGG